MKPANFNQFKGTDKYIASEALQDIVNVAIALERPLLVKGEPGTGKTLLADNISHALGKKFLRWNIKSTTKAQEGLYIYDTVQRLNDSRFGTGDVSDIKRYIKLGKLGESFAAKEQGVLLIDEIDKADLEFPNDLLAELDEMQFYIPETQETIKAKLRPIVLITSNSEKELPDAFLRRCVFHYIEFPDPELMEDIVRVHFPDIKKALLKNCMDVFYDIRSHKNLKKRPSTSELIDWLAVLIKGGIPEKDVLEQRPFMGTLLKYEQDLDYVLNRASVSGIKRTTGLREF